MNEYQVYKKLYGVLAWEVRHHPTYIFGIFSEGPFVFFNRIINVGLTQGRNNQGRSGDPDHVKMRDLRE